MGEISHSDFDLSGWGENKALVEGICTHCQRAVAFKRPTDGITCLHFKQSVPVEKEGNEVIDHYFVMGICPHPQCNDATIVYRVESHFQNQGWVDEQSVIREEVVHPPGTVRRILSDEVPKSLRDLYAEAGRVEFLSPNSAAFIARRILEQTLRKQLRSNKRLVDLIDAFLDQSGIPDQLHQLMHDVRGFGNIAGHPSQDESGDWIDVDQVEASYILDVVHELLKFVHVRPARQEAMRERLEQKKRGERPLESESANIVIAGIPPQNEKRSEEDELPF